jgi:hypothetical protein
VLFDLKEIVDLSPKSKNNKMPKRATTKPIYTQNSILKGVTGFDSR